MAYCGGTHLSREQITIGINSTGSPLWVSTNLNVINQRIAAELPRKSVEEGVAACAGPSRPEAFRPKGVAALELGGEPARSASRPESGWASTDGSARTKIPR